MPHGDEWRDLEVIAADMRGVAGVDGLVLTMRDITDRKQLDAVMGKADSLMLGNLTSWASVAATENRPTGSVTRSVAVTETGTRWACSSWTSTTSSW